MAMQSVAPATNVIPFPVARARQTLGCGVDSSPPASFALLLRRGELSPREAGMLKKLDRLAVILSKARNGEDGYEAAMGRLVKLLDEAVRKLRAEATSNRAEPQPR